DLTGRVVREPLLAIDYLAMRVPGMTPAYRRLQSIVHDIIGTAFSEVVIIDFSCADEVVAKLLQQFLEDDARDAFFVFRGVHEPHRDQIEVVLSRQGLAAVVETEPGSFELVGVHTADEEEAWRMLEEKGSIEPEEEERLFDEARSREAVASLVRRGLAFRSPTSRRLHALSHLVAHLL
ncbi:MAG: hypothetical protein R3253_16985, partial [Longimicrobiales bacterium]|nr:hypothetical protein [Longimicrobiales bacterium]